MSKTSNHAKLRVLKTWLDSRNVKSVNKKQPDWLKEDIEEHERASGK